jgi:hypothetical protein
VYKLNLSILDKGALVVIDSYDIIPTKDILGCKWKQKTKEMKKKLKMKSIHDDGFTKDGTSWCLRTLIYRGWMDSTKWSSLNFKGLYHQSNWESMHHGPKYALQTIAS